MSEAKGYGELVEKAKPTYIEAKAYMHVGFSRRRLVFENMPSHKEMRAFAARLAAETTYDIIDESEESRVVLLSRLGKPKRFGGG